MSDRLAGTLAADEAGRPLVLHHGTFDEFTVFTKSRDIGFHFGTRQQALDRRSEKAREMRLKDPGEWRVMKVALSVRKVLVYPDDPAQWTSWNAVTELSRLVDVDFLDRIRRDGVTDSREAARRLRTLMLELGYDAIAYRNMFESRVGSRAEWSWLVLDRTAIVNLPETIAGDRLDRAVGRPEGLPLPQHASDIEGARGKNGRMRLKRDKQALLNLIETLADSGGGAVSHASIGCGRAFDRAYPISFGADVSGEVQLDIGRVTINLPADRDELFEDVADDFVSHVGLQRPARGCLLYEWVPGETLEAFGLRVRHAVDVVRERAGLDRGPVSPVA